MYIYIEHHKYDLISVRRLNNRGIYKITYEDKFKNRLMTVGELRIVRGKLRSDIYYSFKEDKND